MLFPVVDAFGVPARHDIHTPGAIPVEVRSSDPGSDSPFFGPIKPSQSLSNVRCQAWLLQRPAPCPHDAALASIYWPKLAQTSEVLYVWWQACGEYWYAPAHAVNDGFNVEYLGSNRTLTIHCYFATPWIQTPGPPGVTMTVAFALLVVPTNAFRPGKLTIVQDDRLEHLAGDQSTQFQVATATIS
jgi:hypothetical protein